MVASIDLSEAGSLGHRSTASSSGSGPGPNKMKLSYPNPMTTNEEVEPDSMDEYHPDSAYSFLHDASSAIDSTTADGCSVVTDDTSSTSDKVSSSVLDVRKAETSKWVETAAAITPSKECRRSTLTSLPSKDEPTQSNTPSQLVQDVDKNLIVPGGYSISHRTEPDSAASSFASIRSLDSNATIVTPQSALPKALYSQVVAESLPDEPAAPPSELQAVAPAASEAHAQIRQGDIPFYQKQASKTDEPAKASGRGSSHLVTRSLIILATVLAISTVKLIESVPSFADLKSHSHSTGLSTALAGGPASVSTVHNSAPSNFARSGSTWTAPSPDAHRLHPSALAVVPTKELVPVEPVRSSQDDWVDEEEGEEEEEEEKEKEEELDYAQVLEAINLQDAQEREAFEIDGAVDAVALDDDNDQAEAEANDSDDDAEHDLFALLLRGFGAPELVEHVNGLVESVGDNLSPYFESVTDAWRDSVGQVPVKLSHANHLHRQLRHRGRKAIGRRVRQVEQQGVDFVAGWLIGPANKAQVAWAQTTDTAKAAAHGAEEAWAGSQQFAGEAWARAAEDEPAWTKRQAGEKWSVLGPGSVWKGLARRGVQGERLVRNPTKLGGLLGKSFNRAREIKIEVDTFRKNEARKHRETVVEIVNQWRRSFSARKGAFFDRLSGERQAGRGYRHRKRKAKGGARGRSRPRWRDTDLGGSDARRFSCGRGQGLKGKKVSRSGRKAWSARW